MGDSTTIVSGVILILGHLVNLGGSIKFGTVSGPHSIRYSKILSLFLFYIIKKKLIFLATKYDNIQHVCRIILGYDKSMLTISIQDPKKSVKIFI